MRTIHRNITGIILLSQDRRILLCKSYAGGAYASYWIIPGGGIDEGEDKFEAAKREMSEEVGIDISTYKSSLLDTAWTDKQEKVLRETGEKVVADMTFHVFVVNADKDAHDILPRPGDDITEASWHPIEDLSKLNVPPITMKAFQSIGLL